MDIPCRIQDGSKKTKQVIAYCLQNAAEIFKQINMVLPTEIDMEEMGNNVIAGCYHTPGFYHDRKIRTVVFNTNFDWENLLEKSYDEYKQDHFHTTGHFINNCKALLEINFCQAVPDLRTIRNKISSIIHNIIII